MKDSPERVHSARAAVEAAGGKWHGIYYTFGEYDFIVLTEAPDDETAFSTIVAIGAGGNVRTTTLKAFTESEAMKLIEKLP